MTPETIAAYREAFGGRRFLLTVGAGIVDTLLLVGGYIDQETYSNLTLWTVAAYIAAGTAQKVNHALGTRKHSRAAGDSLGSDDSRDVRGPSEG